MKKLIVKELREQFKVALLGLAVLTVMLIIGFQSSTEEARRAAVSQGYGSRDGLQPLLAKSLLIQVCFFCALFGTLLGWRQIRAESHPDLWAFLVHRPISRARILRSKVLSGSLLYGAAAGLPLLALVMVTSIPGQVAAPFEWAMALPLLAIFLSGLPYYLAGLLTGLRKARWFASRGFGLGLAVAANLGLFAVPEFWHATLIIIAAGVILALAVWGSFQTGGHYRAQPVLGRLALTTASLVSGTVLLGLAIMVLLSAILPHRGYSWSQYQLLKDGRIVRITQHPEDEATDATEIVELNGAPVLEEKTGRKIKLKELTPRYAGGLSAMVDFEDPSGQPRRSRDRYSDSARFFSPWRALDKAIWYLTGEGRLVAYHGMTRRLVDSLSPPGKAGSGSADDARFLHPQDYAWGYVRDYSQPEVLASARTAYLVDLEKRLLQPLFTATNGDAIGGFVSGTLRPASPLQDFVLIVTRGSIQGLDWQGKTLLNIPYEPPYPSYPSVNVYPLESSNGFVVRFQPDYDLNKALGGTLLGRVKWLNADGSLRQTLALPKLPEPRQEGWRERLLLPLVPPAVPIYTWDEPGPIWHWLRFGPALLCVGLGGWLGRKHHLPRGANIGWGIFHLLFGVPGLLAYLAVQEWPAQETCAACQKRRVVDRELCEHCGAAFPPPERNGTEIFEPLNAEWAALAKPGAGSP